MMRPVISREKIDRNVVDSDLTPLLQNDVYGKLSEYLEKDGMPGLPVGFKCLSEFYSHKQGGVTDWTGHATSGKTYFALETLFGLAEMNGKRFGLYLPDVGSDNEILQKMVKMKTGKDFSNKYGNKITQDEMAKALPWIMHHFIIFKKKDFKKGITPVNFWEKIAYYHDDGGSLDGGLADSWKNFKHIYQSREDSYLDEMLSIRNEMSEELQVHYHTIAHAVKTELAEGMTKSKGKRRVPNAWDIKGGGSWNANGKNIITVDREDKFTTGVNLYINKVKPEDVGCEGSIIGQLFLDPKRGRYYEKYEDEVCFAYEHIKVKPKPKVIYDPELSFDISTDYGNKLSDDYPF